MSKNVIYQPGLFKVSHNTIRRLFAVSTLDMENPLVGKIPLQGKLKTDSTIPPHQLSVAKVCESTIRKNHAELSEGSYS